jgi:hypothetical protein
VVTIGTEYAIAPPVIDAVTHGASLWLLWFLFVPFGQFATAMAAASWADHVLNARSRTYPAEQPAVEPGGFTTHSDMALALLKPIRIVVPAQRTGAE